MKSSTKAALLSGLVFPGIGHLYLKRYRRAALLVLVATLALSVILIQAMQQARLIVDKVLRGEIALDPEVIATQVEAASSATDSAQVSIAYMVLIACWLIAIVDCYRLGRALDN